MAAILTGCSALRSGALSGYRLWLNDQIVILYKSTVVCENSNPRLLWGYLIIFEQLIEVLI